MGSDILSRFLRQLQKTVGFGTTAVVGKAIIRQAFIRQMPVSIRAHLATQPDSASLESLAVLYNRALALVSESGKLVGLLEDLSRRLKKLETATPTAANNKNYGRTQTAENRATKTPFVPNAQAKPFIPIIKMITDEFFSQTFSKLAVLTSHLSAIITKHSLIRHTRAETLARYF